MKINGCIQYANLIRLVVIICLLIHYDTLYVYGLSAGDDSSINYERENLKFDAIENVNGTGFTNVRQRMENSQIATLSINTIGSGSYSSSGISEYNSVNESEESDDQGSKIGEDSLFDGFPDYDLISLKSANQSGGLYSNLSASASPTVSGFRC